MNILLPIVKLLKGKPKRIPKNKVNKLKIYRERSTKKSIKDTYDYNIDLMFDDVLISRDKLENVYFSNGDAIEINFIKKGVNLYE